MSASRRPDLSGLLTAGLLLGAWEAAVAGGLLDLQTLPAPSAVAASGVDLLASGELVADLLHTLRVTLLGWGLASLLGLGLGLLLGLWAPAWRWSMASLEVLRAVPPVSLVPLALFAFGFSVRTELALVLYASAWPVLVHTVDGLRTVRPELRDVARTLRLSRRDTLCKVVLPAAVPSVVVGLQLGLSLALVLAVVAELVGNPSGLGDALVTAQLALRPEEVLLHVAVIGLLGVALNAAFRVLIARALPSADPRRSGAR